MEFRSIPFINLVVAMLAVSFWSCQSVPVGRPIREVDITTTSRVYQDRFQINHQTRPIGLNPSINDKMDGPSESDLLKVDPQRTEIKFENSKSLDKVKAVNLGEKILRQSQTDDDENLGEYTDLEDGNCDSAERKEKDSVPMMVIHQVEMVAVEVPVKSKVKFDKSNEENEHSCSNSRSNNMVLDSLHPRSQWNPNPQPRVARMGVDTENKHGFGVGIGEGRLRLRNEGDRRDLYNLYGSRQIMENTSNDKKESPFETRQAPKDCRYFY